MFDLPTTCKQVTEPGDVFVRAPHRSSLDGLAELGVRTSDINLEVVSRSDVVVVAVKPDVVPGILREIAPHLSKGRANRLDRGRNPSRHLGEARSRRVVRVMPYMPGLVSGGVIVSSMGSLAMDEDRDTVHALMGTVGLVVEVKGRG